MNEARIEAPPEEAPLETKALHGKVIKFTW